MRRSCRTRLNLHNDRRRKRIPEQLTPRHDLLNPQPRSRRTRTRRKRVPYGEPAGSDDLEGQISEGIELEQVAHLHSQRTCRNLTARKNLNVQQYYSCSSLLDTHYTSCDIQVQRRQASGASLNTLKEEAATLEEQQGSDDYHRGPSNWQPPLSVLQGYNVRPVC